MFRVTAFGPLTIKSFVAKEKNIDPLLKDSRASDNGTDC